MGATYFTLLALIEWFRIDEVPLDAARAWGALPGGGPGMREMRTPRRAA